MKKFDEFINEDNEKPKAYSFTDFWEITDYVTNILKKKLEEIEVGNEGTTVTTASTDDDIPGIGKRKDYQLEDGSYSHMIIGVRLFYGNSDFVRSFNSMTEFANHIIKVEETIKSTVNVEKIANFGDYYCYLVPVTEEMKNAAKSTEGVRKFDL